MAGKRDQGQDPKERIAALSAEVEEMTELAKRVQADFINYRRRVEEEQVEMRSRVQAETIKQLLPMIDNFTRAVEHVPDEIKESDWVEGVRGIEMQLEQILQEVGVEKIEPKKGELFDPQLHEAVAVEYEDKGDPHAFEPKVIEALQPGYLHAGILIRPASVKVLRSRMHKILDESAQK